MGDNVQNQHDMKKILIAVAQYKGHLSPTFRLAQALKTKSYQVVYACEDVIMMQYIREQGFETVVGINFLFPDFDYGKKGFEGFIERFTSKLTGINTKMAKERLVLFEKMLQTVQPDLLLLDAFMSYNYMLLKGSRPPVSVLQTMISTYKQDDIPPITTLSTPAKNILEKLKTQFLWQNQSIHEKLRRLIYFEMSLWKTTKKIAQSQGIDIVSQARHDKVFHAGLKDVPEIVLSPESFDFSESEALDFQIHAGLMIAEQSNVKIDDRLNKIFADKKDQTLIYCSLGTVSGVHYEKYLDFYKKVIKTFTYQSDFQLILSIGQEDIKSFGTLPSHIHLFNSVPQREVLKYADVMITHGGLNSVLESIVAEVPMLVVPLSRRWDQNGNAARVVYHGVGLHYKIQSIREKEILKSIKNLTQNQEFKTNIKQLKQKIADEDNLNKVIEVIENQMNNSRVIVNKPGFSHILTT